LGIDAASCSRGFSVTIIKSPGQEEVLAFRHVRSKTMCRNIKTLANFEPPATDDEIRASSLQFVRKLSGTTKPSRVNEAAFNQAVNEVTAAAHRLVHSLHTNAPPRNREVEMQKAKERSLKRFA
jgi:hypothetical protein